MKNTIQLNHRHRKRILFLWHMILILSIVVGCGKNYDTQVVPSPIVDSEYSEGSNDAGYYNEQDNQTKVRIHFINTGNSDAILIEQKGCAALIDGGDNDDEECVVNYIRQLGIEQLDYVFATHPDADHIGGLDAVLEEMKVGKVLVGNGKAETKTYTDFIHAIMDKGLMPSVPLLNATFPLGDATLTIVSVANELDVNNCSLVILYTYGETKAIFMGDADQSIEKAIDVKLVGDVDLIKVGHHGAKTSSNEAFIKAIQPEYAVITCGKENKYNHPDQVTLDTLDRLGVCIYRTDQMGDIVFEITNLGMVPLKRETIVYYTENGKKYHKDKNCSNMKEPITATIDEIGDRTPCSKCYD